MCEELLTNFQKLLDHSNALKLLVDAFNCPTFNGLPVQESQQRPEIKLKWACHILNIIPQNSQVFHADNMVDYRSTLTLNPRQGGMFVYKGTKERFRWGLVLFIFLQVLRQMMQG